jgi:hypothetical protein
MTSLTPTQFSFLFRQEWLIFFGLTNVFYGLCNDSLVHIPLTYLLPGVYATLVTFLVYFFCKYLGYFHNDSTQISTRDE